MNNLTQNNLEDQKREAKLQLLLAKEGKYQKQPSRSNLGIFVGLLLVEFFAAFALVYEDSQDILKSLSSATFPVVITLAASYHQAQTYEIPKEKSQLQKQYKLVAQNEPVNQENNEV